MALVFAAGAVIALIVSAIGATIHRGPITQEESALLSTALGAAIGAVATYLGTGARDRDKNDDEQQPGKETLNNAHDEPNSRSGEPPA